MPHKRAPTTRDEPLFAGFLSGATGGPSTARGVAYQLQYSLYEALNLIGETLAAPFKNPILTLEAREVVGETATRWDLSLNLPHALVEVKTNATRIDIIEWLHQIRQASADPSARFHLVYGNINRLVTSLSALIRLAAEAGTDEVRFKKLVEKERIKEGSDILDELGPTHLSALRRMELRHYPERVLEQQVRFMAQMLAPGQDESLQTHLRDRFLDGLQRRSSYEIQALIAEIGRRGITLSAPKAVVLHELSPELRGALLVLSQCPSGLPGTILAETLNVRPEDLSQVLAPLIGSQSIGLGGERWRLLIRPSALTSSEEPAVLERGLSAVLRYVEQHRNVPAGRGLVLEALALTRACYQINPKSIVRAFNKLEQLLKRIGNKHLLEELADITVAAAERPPHEIEDAMARALALICGKSWALQRMGDLAGARYYAKLSLDLGEAIPWPRNTAFCLKCTGRIFRLEAEVQSDPSERKRLLQESIQLLTDAIDKFCAMPEIGPDHAEVGDCYSLMARTYLVAKNYSHARRALQEAYRRIPANGAKDHLDLLILTGDIEAATNHGNDAEDRYTEALQLPQADDVQTSEIIARGYYQRAVNRASAGRVETALADYRKAEELWNHVEEPEQAAKARWAIIKLEKADEGIIKALDGHPSPLVRWEAYRMYQERYPAVPSAVANRRAPSTSIIQQLLREAQQEIAIKYQHP